MNSSPYVLVYRSLVEPSKPGRGYGPEMKQQLKSAARAWVQAEVDEFLRTHPNSAFVRVEGGQEVAWVR